MSLKNKKEDSNRVTSVYGVYGLAEWEVLIPAGSAKLRVKFTGGRQSPLGVVPATFSTQSLAMKHIIETSPHFLNRRIVRLK